MLGTSPIGVINRNCFVNLIKIEDDGVTFMKESPKPYRTIFDSKKDDLSLENTYCWQIFGFLPMNGPF